ncbi:hypothetical protein DERF_008506 [Dermatophagoides farinae]|uniref:Uncharacterized protein n=1 Tax=Dermatophagoides farinae TaxID=6954 RepID=A0A922L4D9_DERFA|nr:hypothetical protein DERF_008506 [Dermatophagoides farinae]
MDRTERPFGFGCKKWTIIVLCMLSLAIKIISAAFILANINKFVDEMHKKEMNITKTQAILLLILFQSITISFTLIGLIGAYKENFCLSLIFSILYSLNLIKVIHDLYHDQNYWFSLIIMAILLTINISFTYDLYCIDHQQQQQQQQSSDNDSMKKKTKNDHHHHHHHSSSSSNKV